MAGTEREFMSKMDSMTAPPRDQAQQQAPVTFLEASHCMRDFWRLNAGTDHRTESHQLQPATDRHMQDSERGEYSLRPFSYGMDHRGESSARGVPMEVPHDVYYTNLCYPPGDPAYNSSSAPYMSTYTNFFNPGPCNNKHMPSTDSHYNYNSPAPVNIFGYSSTQAAGESINCDIETLRHDLAFKCPRSNDLLIAITKTADAIVQEHGTTDDEDNDEEEDDDPRPPRLFPLSQLEQDQELRGAIVEHPHYPEMVVAHIRIFKIGAPKELRNKLDDITKKFQRFQDGKTTRIGDDPSLDFFMRSYVDLLRKLGEDLEDPFNKFIQYKDQTTKQLEDICGHYVETGPDESDNYGYDVCAGPMDGGYENDELERMKEDQSMLYPYNDIDESIVIDASLPDDELRKKLMQKFGRHIGGLKAEFNRVRKKGKLPSQARNVLKDWFNRHSYWPYPSEAEKQYLQRMCALNLKQINNWFINERKRHWSCEGKCMHPNAKFYNSSTGLSGDKGPLE